MFFIFNSDFAARILSFYQGSFIENLKIHLYASAFTSQRFGMLISVNYLTQIFLIPLSFLIYFYGRIFYKKLRTLKKSKLPKFDIGFRFALVISLFGSTVVFSYFLPFIVLFFVFIMFLLFWIEKVLYFESLKHYLYESKINSKILLFSLPYFLLIAVGISIFSLGNFKHFPSSRGYFISKFDVLLISLIIHRTRPNTTLQINSKIFLNSSLKLVDSCH